MGIVSLIRVALEAILELSKDFKLLAAAYQKSQEMQFLAAKAQAMQSIQEAVSEEDYKKAQKELHDAISRL